MSVSVVSTQSSSDLLLYNTAPTLKWCLPSVCPLIRPTWPPLTPRLNAFLQVTQEFKEQAEWTGINRGHHPIIVRPKGRQSICEDCLRNLYCTRTSCWGLDGFPPNRCPCNWQKEPLCSPLLAHFAFDRRIKSEYFRLHTKTPSPCSQRAIWLSIEQLVVIRHDSCRYLFPRISAGGGATTLFFIHPTTIGSTVELYSPFDINTVLEPFQRSCASPCLRR